MNEIISKFEKLDILKKSSKKKTLEEYFITILEGYADVSADSQMKMKPGEVKDAASFATKKFEPKIKD